MRIVRDTMAQAHLKAVIVRVTVDGEESPRRPQSMTGCPRPRTCTSATAPCSLAYRRYSSDEVSLDDKLSTWLPEVPNADR